MLPGMIGEVVQRYAVECLMIVYWTYVVFHLKVHVIVALNIHDSITELCFTP